jgi:hypothetical protein
MFWATVRASAVRRLGGPALTGYAVLLAVGLIVVVGALVVMRTGR